MRTAHWKRPLIALVLAGIAATAICCADDGAGDPDGGGGSSGGGGGGGGNGAFPLGDVTFPWQIFDNSVPDVPLAAAPAHTWYCDAVHGNDAWDGASATMVSASSGPKQSLTAMIATGNVKAGDTILLAGGLYRERPDFNSLTGKAGAPITIGSYGRGTGAPIIDGGVKPKTWTKYTAQGQTTVWQSSTSGLAKISANTPVLGIYVSSAGRESALREVVHGQLLPYANDPLPPNETQANITDNSSKWYYDAGSSTLYADFGGTLGSGDPNGAEVSILYNSRNGPAGHEPLLLLAQGRNYFSFIGLTVRAGSWHGIYSESSGVTVDHCDVKFNGGGGVFFDVAGNDLTVAGNHVSYSRIWMNVLDNWPRFNNGNTGGGWPGALSWYSQSDALGEGNVVYDNGGEGLIFWGTNGTSSAAHVSKNNVARHSIIFDNWSVNVYLDNTQNARIEQNFVFDHPRDPTLTFDKLLSVSMGYNTDFGKRLTPNNLSLADEPGSAFDSHAHLSDITVVNNIFAGGKTGFVDYDDGTQVVFHGLKNCVVANNTWVLSSKPVVGTQPFVWRHLFDGANPDASSNSFVQNNIMITGEAGDYFVQNGQAGAGAGITTDYNFYGGPGHWATVDTSQDFATWKAARAPWDQHSATGDAMLGDLAAFNQTKAEKPVYDWTKAIPVAGSPTLGAGMAQAGVTTDFTGATRPSAADQGAIAHH